MSVINKSRLSKQDLLRKYLHEIVYDMTFSDEDYEMVSNNMTMEGDTLIIDIRGLELPMDILYFHTIITPDYNIFLKKGIHKLSILNDNDITYDIISSWVDKNTGYTLHFKDGFILESSLPIVTQ